MCKRFITVLLLLLLVPTVAAAEEELVKDIEAVDGQVVLPKNEAIDGIMYTLDGVDDDTVQVKQRAVSAKNAITTFSTLDYKNGLFDSDLVKSNGLPSHFWDNSTVAKNYSGSIYTILLNKKVNITAYHNYHQRVNNDDSRLIRVTFFNDDVAVNYDLTRSISSSSYNYLPTKTVGGQSVGAIANKIVVDTSTYGVTSVRELEFFYDFNVPVYVYAAATNVKATVTETTAKITYTPPQNNANHVKTEVVFNGSLNSLKPNTKYSAIVRSHYDDGKYVDVTIEFTTLADTTPPSDVTNLKADVTAKDVKLSYTLPADTDYSHVQIYRDGTLIADNHKSTTYTDKNTAYSTSYTYKVVSVDSAGNKSSGVSISKKTAAESPPEIEALKATATSNSVALSWQNTKRDGFDGVTIYRKQKTIAANVRALFSASDGYTPIFTTNGTEFTDLTVEPDTKYTYKVTTTIAGVESAGVTVDVKTKPVTVEGGAVDKDDNGDYVLTWTAPTTGKLKVLIDGTQYKIVAAADKKVVIPASVMVYDFWGNPKVTLVPVNDAGEDVGTPAPPKPGPDVGSGLLPSPEELKSVIDVTGLVQTGMSLIALIGGFVLLRLAFLFVPKLIKMIRRSWR